MSCNPYCPKVSPVVTSPTVVYRDFYHPQVVPVVHPVEIVNRHHCVPCPQHVYTYSSRDEMGGMVSPSMVSPSSMKGGMKGMKGHQFR